ncbi:MAG: hypothetical protein ABI600_18675, partial [Luteolibacter sp.]
GSGGLGMRSRSAFAGFFKAGIFTTTGFFAGFCATTGALAEAGFLAETAVFTGFAAGFFATGAGFEGLTAGFSVLFFGAVFGVFFFAAMAQR